MDWPSVTGSSGIPTRGSKKWETKSASGPGAVTIKDESPGQDAANSLKQPILGCPPRLILRFCNSDIVTKTRSHHRFHPRQSDG